MELNKKVIDKMQEAQKNPSAETIEEVRKVVNELLEENRLLKRIVTDDSYWENDYLT